MKYANILRVGDPLQTMVEIIIMAVAIVASAIVAIAIVVLAIVAIPIVAPAIVAITHVAIVGERTSSTSIPMCRMRACRWGP